jgi:hypothetical protein
MLFKIKGNSTKDTKGSHIFPNKVMTQEASNFTQCKNPEE